MVRPLWSLLVAAVAPVLAAQQTPQADAGGAIPAAVDATALFAASCAQCHGLDGSGTGPTVLDRPARDFKEGGFSFGNTPETIARTIAHGIPGSPMPAFAGALSDTQLRALAEYVLTLGPPVKEVSAAETLLHVTDRPLVVRGILPPLEEGGPMIPRGLLIGTPDGLTFQYAADDVRLLAVRLGDFVRRADWGDRGGLPLEPLGKVVWKSAAELDRPWGGPPVDGDSPLSARLMSTGSVLEAQLDYALLNNPCDGSQQLRAIVTETPGTARLAFRQGFSRHLRVATPAGAMQVDGTNPPVSMFLGRCAPLENCPARTRDGADGQWTEQWWLRDGGTETAEILHTVAGPGITVRNMPANLVVDFGLSPGRTLDARFEIFVITPWSPDVSAALAREIAR